jgi:AcrR family transcriptional regulator
MKNKNKTRTLSRIQIIEYAYEFSLLGSFKNLNLKLIAEHFSVKPPSLYNHLDSLEDLLGDLRAMAVRELTKSLSLSIQGVSGKDAIREIAHAYRRFAKENAGVYELTIESPSGNTEHQKAADDLLNTIMAVFKNTPKDETIHKIRILRSYLHGFVSIELGHGFGLPVDVDKTFEIMIENFIKLTDVI